MDNVFQQKEKIEYSDVLNRLKSGQVLFVEGRPGCGKTSKITRDWTGTHDGPIRLMLLVSLRILNLLYLVKPPKEPQEPQEPQEPRNSRNPRNLRNPRFLWFLGSCGS